MRNVLLFSSFVIIAISLASCTVVAPPIPITSAGQVKVLDKGQLELAGACGTNNFEDPILYRNTQRTGYGRIRYGITPKISLG